jgi:hypothetical protein
MTGNGHVQFGGGLMEKGPCATSPAAYPTKLAILLNACAIIGRVRMRSFDRILP